MVQISTDRHPCEGGDPSLAEHSRLRDCRKGSNHPAGRHPSEGGDPWLQVDSRRVAQTRSARPGLRDPVGSSP